MDNMFQGTGSPLTQAGIDAALAKLGTPAGAASLWSVLAVETRGFGYLRDRRPKILFERHIFHKRTDGRFSAANPDISNPLRGGYSGGMAEYGRLARAMALDPKAAVESASWGLGQVMGFNAASLGYGDAMRMAASFASSEDAQLDGCVRFIDGNPALKKAYVDQNWSRVAFYYNGPTYSENQYDAKLARAYTACEAKLPDIAVRTGQALLTYAGYDPGSVDGRVGAATRRAIDALKARGKVTVTEAFDDGDIGKLRELVGL